MHQHLTYFPSLDRGLAQGQGPSLVQGPDLDPSPSLVQDLAVDLRLDLSRGHNHVPSLDRDQIPDLDRNPSHDQGRVPSPSLGPGLAVGLQQEQGGGWLATTPAVRHLCASFWRCNILNIISVILIQIPKLRYVLTLSATVCPLADELLLSVP